MENALSFLNTHSAPELWDSFEFLFQRVISLLASYFVSQNETVYFCQDILSHADETGYSLIIFSIDVNAEFGIQT